MALKDKMHIFTGNSNPALGQEVADYLGMRLGSIEISKFPDTETFVKVNEDVRGSDVFVVQSTCAPVNENLMELLVMIDCLKRASTERITAVIPYFGYARQDRKFEGRVPISAKLVANLIAKAGADRVLTVDLHAAQIQGFFDIPVDHLYGSPVLVNYLKKLDLKDLIAVSVDVGGAAMVRAYAKRLNVGLAIVDKRRIGPQETEALNIIGEIEGKNAVIVDDMITTATSITETCKVLKANGAKEVYLCATHPVLCGKAIEKLEAVKPKEVIITNTIPLGEKKRPFFTQLSVAKLLGEAMRRIHMSESVSSLFLN